MPKTNYFWCLNPGKPATRFLLWATFKARIYGDLWVVLLWLLAKSQTLWRLLSYVTLSYVNEFMDTFELCTLTVSQSKAKIMHAERSISIWRFLFLLKRLKFKLLFPRSVCSNFSHFVLNIWVFWLEETNFVDHVNEFCICWVQSHLSHHCAQFCCIYHSLSVLKNICINAHTAILNLCSRKVIQIWKCFPL